MSKQFNVPTGFRFQPNDTDLIFYLYLWLKSGRDSSVLPPLIAPASVYDATPEALLGDRLEAYFVTPRRRRFKKGTRVDRQAVGGTWMLNNKKKSCGITNCSAVSDDGLVGHKQTLAFHRAGVKKATGYVMHEYEICAGDDGDHDQLNDYVLCCIKLNPEALKAEKKKKKEKEKELGGCRRWSSSISTIPKP